MPEPNGALNGAFDTSDDSIRTTVVGVASSSSTAGTDAVSDVAGLIERCLTDDRTAIRLVVVP